MLVNVITFSYPITKAQKSALEMKAQIDHAQTNKHIGKSNLMDVSPIAKSQQWETNVTWEDLLDEENDNEEEEEGEENDEIDGEEK
ncbi:hypothetical protein [Parasitella parasitica]|uniref:Uncharacterized protein n=1 Tax=Parasitella parasitica TaxID=35722 RepID=A0A0B7N2M9_9FUNG|nr:hypothetical protein [Parasitella parasitica]